MDARQIQDMMKLSFGKGGPEDFAEARRLLGLPAAQGKAKAQLSLGGMHYHEVRRHALSLHAAEVPLPRSRPNRRSLSLCPEIEIWACRQRDRDLGIATRPAASKPAEPLIGAGVATSRVPVAIGASGWGRGGRGLGGRGSQRVQSAAAIATDDAVGAVAHLLGQASLQVPAGSSDAGAAASVAAPAPEALSMPPPPPATVSVTSLADAQFSTGRPEPPESTIGGQSTCIVCFTNPKSHLAAPCGHQSACGACSAQMQECPVCRTPVQMWMQVRVA